MECECSKSTACAGCTRYGRRMCGRLYELCSGINCTPEQQSKYQQLFDVQAGNEDTGGPQTHSDTKQVESIGEAPQKPVQKKVHRKPGPITASQMKNVNRKRGGCGCGCGKSSR